MEKSRMKKAYKEARRSAGVFRIESSTGDKVYVGSGTDVLARINRHKAELRFGNHRNRELQQLWDDSGESAFDFAVLDVLDQEENISSDPCEDLQFLTEMWIRRLEEEGYMIVAI